MVYYCDDGRRQRIMYSKKKLSRAQPLGSKWVQCNRCAMCGGNACRDLNSKEASHRRRQRTRPSCWNREEMNARRQGEEWSRKKSYGNRFGNWIESKLFCCSSIFRYRDGRKLFPSRVERGRKSDLRPKHTVLFVVFVGGTGFGKQEQPSKTGSRSNREIRDKCLPSGALIGKSTFAAEVRNDLTTMTTKVR